jgi:hypothetical protein
MVRKSFGQTVMSSVERVCAQKWEWDDLPEVANRGPALALFSLAIGSSLLGQWNPPMVCEPALLAP